MRRPKHKPESRTDLRIRFAFGLTFVILTALRVTTYLTTSEPQDLITTIRQGMMVLLDLLVLLSGFCLLASYLKRRRLAEMKLEESERFARETVDALTTHIAILDDSGMIVSTNRALREYTATSEGETKDAVDGANYLMICDAAAGRRCQEWAVLAAGIRAVLAGQCEEQTVEYPAHTATARAWFMGRVTRFLADGPPRVVVSHENITARKLADEQVQKSREAAEFANVTKSAFIANTSHEIRTPMTAIMGYADLLLEPRQTEAERAKCVQTIRRNGEHLLAIVNDILDISKIEACKMTVEALKCDVLQLISDVVALTRPWATKKKLDFAVEFDGPIPRFIETDVLRVRQVLVNLIGNAIKFTTRGQVRLTVSRQITYLRHGLRFLVTDSGIGMNEQQVARLFQPFTQADASTTRRFGGTGLGLTISKRLAKLLGGDITVRSLEGQGSTFTFEIDGGLRDGIALMENVKPSDLNCDVDAGEEAEEQFFNGRILLAEDGEDNQELICMHLRKVGLDVTVADNGRVAVDIARKERFDVILMDMQMPQMDGYSATRTLRAGGMLTPIIALTANVMAEDRVRCIEAGCTEYLGKPCTRQQLLRTLGRYVKKVEVEPKAAPRTAGGHLLPAAVSDGSVHRSKFENEPRMRQALDRFVSRLPTRVKRMGEALAEHNLDELKQTLHQLKGAAGGYGFPQIGELAAAAEERVKASDAFESIEREVASLVTLVRSVQGYDPQSETTEAEPAAAAK